jgi:hypothetical protein
MNKFEAREILIKVFISLRRIGLGLGIGDLLAAVRAVEGEKVKLSEDELRRVARLLWCQSLDTARDFDDTWTAAVSSMQSLTPPVIPATPPPTPPPVVPEPPPLSPSLDAETGPVPSQPELAALPVQVPFTPVVLDESMRLDAYWPVTKRSMAYTWRYLRRLVSDGPEDLLDIDATVNSAASQGFYLAPVFQRRPVNHAHLILLLDQGGSMTPFHRFTRDMIQTTFAESTISRVEVYYFHNVMADQLYLDSYLTEQISWDRAFERCEGETSVLIVSDAGAARGHRRLPRISATAASLFRLRQKTSLVAWLNPMPEIRWADTSASTIGQLVKMYQMDPDGFSSAIDIVRGQQF